MADERGWHLLGDDALLVELPDAQAVARLGAVLRAAPPDGVVDVVPAARTVLVRGSARSRPRWADEVRRVQAGSSSAPATEHGRVVEVPVVYDGDDLAAVAELTALSVDEVVARHLAGDYRVAFGGFMPGFAYLAGLDPALRVPRLATPRTRVPAGAVAIAGEYAAVYPRATPGGWRLLGHTDVVLFDPAHDDRPALLAPGDRVRFTRARASVTGAAGVPVRAEVAVPAEVEVAAPVDVVQPAALEVQATGLLVLVEDLGRAGLAAVGVPRSGAADPAALRAANGLVGNAAGAAGLEVVLGGLVVRFTRTTAIALTGADTLAALDGVPVPPGRAVRAPAGATLVLGAPGAGLRTWLAVRGGIDVPAVLGSRSTDVLSGLGPAPVAPGDWLPLGRAYDGLPMLDRLPEPVGGEDAGAGGAVVFLPATAGPRADWLTDESRRRLGDQEWTVTAASNRVALRLDGEPLTRARAGELESEGLVPGAVQVPLDGRPVVFGPDHPVTGGYPVVAALTAEGIARAAQCRPGDRVRFVVRAR